MRHVDPKAWHDPEYWQPRPYQHHAKSKANATPPLNETATASTAAPSQQPAESSERAPAAPAAATGAHDNYDLIDAVLVFVGGVLLSAACCLAHSVQHRVRALCFGKSRTS